MGDLNRALKDGYSPNSILGFLAGWNKPKGSAAMNMLKQKAAEETQQDILNITNSLKSDYSKEVPAPPPPPEPKTMTTDATPVGGSARGVKINRGPDTGKGPNVKGTRALGRKARNAQMAINNLNLS